MHCDRIQLAVTQLSHFLDFRIRSRFRHAAVFLRAPQHLRITVHRVTFQPRPLLKSSQSAKFSSRSGPSDRPPLSSPSVTKVNQELFALGKARKVEEMLRKFEGLKRDPNTTPDVVSYNTVIAELARHRPEQA